ncbi:MAG: C1 family peptidase [Pirellulales bacterium]
MAKSATRRRPRRSHTKKKDDSFPKTTRPAATDQREPEAPVTTEEHLKRKFDAAPDRIDIRDWFYQPSLAPLPDRVVSCESVPQILNQGREGACTGFALAAVVNFQLNRRNLPGQVSPRMLYEMARRYDEWPGEEYEGSSARGAMIGWARHGVCQLTDWPIEKQGSQHFTPDIAAKAARVPGGAFYRVMHRQVRDMHAALAELGILYCTLMVHRGWGQPSGKAVNLEYVDSGNVRRRSLPVIERQGNADGGHAVAIVGYTYEGFIIQNSWGDGWGEGGYALLPYEDFLLHAADLWAAQLGVPVAADLWVNQGAADTTAGMQRASDAIPLEHIRPYVIDVGNNGLLSETGNYWTTEADVKSLFQNVIRDTTKNWEKRRILLYLHGGLNDEAAAARRIVAYRDVMLANEIYPLHIMWESGAFESLRGLVEDFFVEPDPRAGGVGDWLKKTRDFLVEAKDRTFELTVAKPGTALWDEMKQNAELASKRKDKKGAVQIVAREAAAAMKKLSDSEVKQWELHLVVHSAGAIFAAYALKHLLSVGIPFKSFQMFAPAITVELFKELVMPHVAAKKCPQPTMYILSDVGERDDNVGPSGAYGKSLLYLVSNAFERRREVPILGMERFVRSDVENSLANPDIERFFQAKVDGRPSLVIAGASAGRNDSGGRSGRGARSAAPDPANLSRSETHGGFDNDRWTLNSVLYRILRRAPAPEFTSRDLQF